MPTFRNSSNNNNGGATTLILTDPGQSGDFLIALINNDFGDGCTWTPPDGTWTQVAIGDTSTLGGGFDGSTSVVFTKASATGSSTNYTFTSQNGQQIGILLAYSGVGSAGVNASSGPNPQAPAGPTSWAISALTITPTKDNSTIVYIGAGSPLSGSGSPIFSPPIGGYQTRDSITANDDLFACDVNQTTATATGTVTGTIVHTATNMAAWGYLLALSPQGPSITVQPANQTAIIPNPATATFTVTGSSSGGTLHYQWKKNGSNVGTDSSTLSLSNLTISDQYSSITVDVTDDNGTVTSNTAILIIIEVPNVAWFRA